MAKRKNTVPRVREEEPDDSLLIRSAESLGRVIGSLQRQVRRGTKRVAGIADNAMDAVPKLSRFDAPVNDARSPRKTTRKRAARRSTAARGASGSRKAAKKR